MTGAETAWSDKDLDPGKLFFWRVLAGGVPCQACQGEYHLQRYCCDIVFHIVSVKIKYTYRHILFRLAGSVNYLSHRYFSENGPPETQPAISYPRIRAVSLLYFEW